MRCIINFGTVAYIRPFCIIISRFSLVFKLYSDDTLSDGRMKSHTQNEKIMHKTLRQKYANVLIKFPYIIYFMSQVEHFFKMFTIC